MIAAAGHLFRLARAGYVFAREGVLGLIDPAPLPASARLALKLARLLERPSHAGSTVKLSAALTRLGPTYVKLGQFLATRPDIVGPVLARDLESLQDRMAPFPQAEAEAAVATALGKPVAELFVSFGPAVAAASIAQVHKAEAHGQSLAVKVLRPGVERRFKSDLDTMYFAARTAERHSAEARRLRMIGVVDTLARSVTIEMDLRLEAAAIAEIRDNTKDDPDFRVPAIDWERTARTVLTLEWIDGTPLSNRAALEARILDLPALGRALMQTFLRHALRDGYLPRRPASRAICSPTPDGATAVDFGIVGRLGPARAAATWPRSCGASSARDYRTASPGCTSSAGYVPPHHSGRRPSPRPCARSASRCFGRSRRQVSIGRGCSASCSRSPPCST